MEEADIFSGSLQHHAYTILGGEHWFDSVFLPAALDHASAPECVLAEKCNPFSIEDARALKQTLSETSTGEHRYILYYTEYMTREAQNALLKTIEEVPTGTTIFLVIPRLDLVLDTVLSRTAIIRNRTTFPVSEEAQQQAATFLAWDRQSRLSYIEKLLNRYRSESTLALKGAAFRFLGALEAALYTHHKSTRPVPKAAVEPIWTAKRYLHDAGASPKLLLETVALSVPNVRSL